MAIIRGGSGSYYGSIDEVRPSKVVRSDNWLLACYQNQLSCQTFMTFEFLDLRVVEARARKEGLDKGSRYKETRALMNMKLLAEFLQERDGTTPWKLPGATEEARSDAFRSYLGQLRTEMGLREGPALPAGAE